MSQAREMRHARRAQQRKAIKQARANAKAIQFTMQHAFALPLRKRIRLAWRIVDRSRPVSQIFGRGQA